MAAAKKTEEAIVIRPIDIVTTEVRIVGDTPLIMHAWSEKARRMMLAAQQGRKKATKKEVRNPVDDFINSMYWISGKPEVPEGATEEECEVLFTEAIANGARFGFPATSFKQAAQSAAYRLGWTKNQVGMRGAFFIETGEDGLVEIESDPPILREDLVRVGMGTADLRYRGEFRNWSATLKIQYNASGDISLDAILNALNAGGFTCGVGEWRPEKDGNYGRFHIASV